MRLGGWWVVAPLALLLCTPAVGESIAEPHDAGGVTVLDSVGSRHISLELGADATLVTLRLETASELAAVYLVGPSNAFLVKVGPRFAGTLAPGPFEISLQAGTYHVYLHSLSPMTTTLELEGLAGTVSMIAERPVPGGVRPGNPDRIHPEVATEPFVGRWYWTERFERPSILGMVRHDLVVGPHASHEEYRWRVPGGVVGCVEGTQAALTLPSTGPGGNGWSVAVLPNVPAEEVTVEYFRYSAGVTAFVSNHAFWFERVVEDDVSYPPLPMVSTPAQGMVPGGANYDVACLAQAAGFLLQAVGT